MSNDAKEFLTNLLAGGPQSTSRLYPWAETKGITKRTLLRAAKELDIDLETKDPENRRYRLWSLPPTRDTEQELRQLGVSHVEETVTEECRESDTYDTGLRQGQPAHVSQDCHATSEDDASHLDAAEEVFDTVSPVSDTAISQSEAENTVIPVATTPTTAEDLDWEDHSNVLIALKSLIKPAELAVIDGFSMNGDRSYTDVLNSLLRQGIMRVRELQQQKRYN
ncbi:MAG: hypothetical protein N0C90_12955 [Candidatus Thiodiazotropha endolucinida]|nr:hypothetical protein [Candidatus Thiodiazotropha taylori]MCW4262270.1 hypothetical protein [Candidatus Thiodiazotropha endolucinida]